MLITGFIKEREESRKIFSLYSLPAACLPAGRAGRSTFYSLLLIWYNFNRADTPEITILQRLIFDLHHFLL
jgi:hypothetical protein